MLTISLVGQKGGGGKSTICWILAQAALARSNETMVLLVETDKQGSTSGFVKGAHAAYPGLQERLFCEKASNGEELYDLIEGHGKRGRPCLDRYRGTPQRSGS